MSPSQLRGDTQTRARASRTPTGGLRTSAKLLGLPASPPKILLPRPPKDTQPKISYPSPTQEFRLAPTSNPFTPPQSTMNIVNDTVPNIQKILPYPNAHDGPEPLPTTTTDEEKNAHSQKMREYGFEKYTAYNETQLKGTDLWSDLPTAF